MGLAWLTNLVDDICLICQHVLLGHVCAGSLRVDWIGVLTVSLGHQSQKLWLRPLGQPLGGDFDHCETNLATWKSRLELFAERVTEHPGRTFNLMTFPIARRNQLEGTAVQDMQTLRQLKLQLLRWRLDYQRTYHEAQEPAEAGQSKRRAS